MSKKWLLPFCAFCINVSLVHAMDTFDANTNLLTVPNLVIGTTQYGNVAATLGPVAVVSFGGSIPLASSMDTFDVRTNILTIPNLMIGGTEYRNVQVRLGVVSVNGIGTTTSCFELPPSPGP